MLTGIGSGLLAALFAAGAPLMAAGPPSLPLARQAADQASEVVEPVDINKASAAELEVVPGIGPVLAQRIVEFREEHGPFERVDDLLNVRGIGVRSLERIRPYVTVGKRGAKPKTPRSP